MELLVELEWDIYEKFAIILLQHSGNLKLVQNGNLKQKAIEWLENTSEDEDNFRFATKHLESWKAVAKLYMWKFTHLLTTVREAMIWVLTMLFLPNLLQIIFCRRINLEYCWQRLSGAVVPRPQSSCRYKKWVMPTIGHAKHHKQFS